MPSVKPQLTPESLRAFVTDFQRLIAQQEAYLTELDAAIGDADHGSGMKRGVDAAAAALGTQHEVSALLKAVATAFISKVGGASGPLYGTAFLRASTALSGQAEPARATTLAALEAAYTGLKERGKAEVGDKTMLDAWRPALDTLQAGGTFAQAAAAAQAGAQSSADLVAHKGRASYLGERSRGHIDPGAASSALMWDALARTVGAQLEGVGAG